MPYNANSGPLVDLNGSTRTFDDPEIVNTSIGQLDYLDLGAYERSPNTLESWADENGISREALSDESTPISYLERFAYGLGPEDPASPLSIYENELQRPGVPMTMWKPIEPKIYYYHIRRIDFASAGLTYSLQASSDLKAWTKISPRWQVIDSNESIEVVHYEIASEGPLSYLRLLIAIE